MPSAVNEADLRHLYQLVEVQDGGPAWIHMMDRSLANMTYQAWRRDPPVGFVFFFEFFLYSFHVIQIQPFETYLYLFISNLESQSHSLCI